MLTDNELREKLEKVMQEARRGNRAVDVTRGYVNNQKKPSFFLYLWLSNGTNLIVRHPVQNDSFSKCCVAYRYIDYRLGPIRMLKFKTRATKGYLQLVDMDIEGYWTSSFHVRTWRPSNALQSFFTDCDYDETATEAVKRGVEHIATMWDAPNLKNYPDSDKGSKPVNAIAVEIV